MDRGELGDLAAFAVVAKRCSFSRAAEEIGVSASALSHTIRGLESRTGIRLLNRSTRSVMPTEAGRRLLARLEPALDDIRQALDELNAFRSSPRGTLRLNMPRIAAEVIVMPILPAFLARFPEIDIDIVADDTLVDIVADGFDAGVRFGEQLAADRIAVPLGPRQQFVVVAAPEYLAKRAAPVRPADLVEHQCIRQRFPSGAIYRWQFEQNSVGTELESGGGPTLNDQRMIIEAATAGLGVAYVLESLTAKPLEQGHLIRLMPEWMPPPEHFFLYTSGRRQMPAPLRAFIDFVRESMVEPLRS